MRVIFGVCVLLVTAGAARADAPCHVAVELRGAIVDGTTTIRLDPTDHTTSRDLELPDGGKLVELSLRGHGSSGSSVAVSTAFASQMVSDAAALGADPAVALQLGERTVRIVLQPITGSQVLVAHWTAVADLADGEAQVTVPALANLTCDGTFHAAPGPGATIASVRADAAATRGAATSFSLSHAITLGASFTFARAEPIAWTQDERLGDGTTARATTVIAPPSHTLANIKRALFVVDNSRSMNLVNRAHVGELLEHVGAVLAPGTSIEAIAFDRTPARVLGAWTRAEPGILSAITAAIAKRAPQNGSDLGAALALAHTLLAEGTREPAIVIVITDGVLGDVDADTLAGKLGDARDVDLHAIVLDPSTMSSPSRGALAGAIARLGGSYSELEASDYSTAFPHLASWLEPAWQIGDGELRSGEGDVAFEIVKDGKPAALAAHDETAKATLAPHPAPSTPLVGQLALARHPTTDSRVLARHPFADVTHDLAILSSAGRVAANRHAMIAGGGPYTRMIAEEDPPEAFEPIASLTQATPRPTVIDHGMLQRLFELQLQPAAYHCFQRALGHAPTLAGTVQFGIELGRGEVTHVVLAGTGDAAFDSCLVDAAYSLQVPLVDPKLDPDDRTIANYPLTFSVRAEKPVVVAGDADSSSPLDIDAIKGGVPAVRPQDAATPLGPLRPGN